MAEPKDKWKLCQFSHRIFPFKWELVVVVQLLSFKWENRENFGIFSKCISVFAIFIPGLFRRWKSFILSFIWTWNILMRMQEIGTHTQTLFLDSSAQGGMGEMALLRWMRWRLWGEQMTGCFFVKCEKKFKRQSFFRSWDFAQSKLHTRMTWSIHTVFSASDCPACLRGGECVTDLRGNLRDSTRRPGWACRCSRS